MDDHNHLRDRLREAYNHHAQERETANLQDWKLPERENFLDLLRKEHKKTLLEIGAGTGRDSLYFQDHGLEPTCIDLSPVMVDLCRQKGLHALVMDSTNLQFDDQSFDAVYTMNSLLHLPKVEFPGALRGIQRVLKPGGVVFLGVYGGYDYEGVWEKDTYRPQRFFSFFTDEDLLSEVRQVFDVLDFHCVPQEPDDPMHFQSLTLMRRDGAAGRDKAAVR